MPVGQDRAVLGDGGLAPSWVKMRRISAEARLRRAASTAATSGSSAAAMNWTITVGWTPTPE